MHALRTMQAEGVGYASLSLCPFLRCTPVAGDSKIYRYVANFWWRRLSAIYDMPGLFHFKSRFRPDYREMFIAAPASPSARCGQSLAWRSSISTLAAAGRISNVRSRARRSRPDRAPPIAIRGREPPSEPAGPSPHCRRRRPAMNCRGHEKSG
jgi:hypothetical protein